MPTLGTCRLTPRLRIVRSGRPASLCLIKPEAAYAALRPLAHGLDREHFWRLDLDSRRRLLGYELVSIGSLDSAIIEPREVFKGALLNNAHGVIVAHSHPSQDTKPSRADHRLTARLVLAGAILGVELVDHLIVSDDRYFSFRKAGLI